MSGIIDEGQEEGGEYRVPKKETRRRAIEAGYADGRGPGGYHGSARRTFPPYLRYDGEGLVGAVAHAQAESAAGVPASRLRPLEDALALYTAARLDPAVTAT